MVTHKGAIHSDEIVGVYHRHLDSLAADVPFLGPLDRLWGLICKGWKSMSVPTGSGNYPTGVTDNDPHFTDESEDEDDEPTRVLCSFPMCTRMTTIDPVYGDLCFEHIRANNE